MREGLCVAFRVALPPVAGDVPVEIREGLFDGGLGFREIVVGLRGRGVCGEGGGRRIGVVECVDFIEEALFSGTSLGSG